MLRKTFGVAYLFPMSPGSAPAECNKMKNQDSVGNRKGAADISIFERYFVENAS
jgi:hypothetical protein